MSYDIIVIGAGHNGLVAAAYLAKRGLRVLVLERRRIVGGLCVTEELFPGYRFSTAARNIGLLRPEIARDLQLGKFGLRVHTFDPQLFCPFPDRESILFWIDARRTIETIGRFSKRDARAFVDLGRRIDEVRRILEPRLLQPPLDLSGLFDLFKTPDARQFFEKLLLTSIADLMNEFFESGYVKAALVSGGIVGSGMGPMSPGTSFGLFYHSTIQAAGRKGVWGYVPGGMGGITQAMAKAARHLGVKITTDAEVKSVMVKNGIATGVELANGKKIYGRAILSNTDPKRTFLKLVDSEHLDRGFRRAIERIRSPVGAMRVYCAAKGVPHYKALPSSKVGPQHKAVVQICPSVNYAEKMWDDVKYGDFPRAPVINLFIQSVMDPSVAPAGRHAFSIGAYHAPYNLRNENWDIRKERYADRVIELLSEYAPNISEVILDRKVVSPLDFERVFGVTDGNYQHGDLISNQVFSSRPLPGWSSYRTPIRSLYLCGSGAHPGPGVSGAAGHNAAAAVLQDLKVT